MHFNHLLVSLLVVLAGCSSSAPTGMPSATSTATPTIRETFNHVTELRDAAVNAGYPCRSWVESNKVTLAASSGTCSDSDVFSVYLSADAVQQVVTNLKGLPGEVHLLVGQNWVINADDEHLSGLQVRLGGQIVRSKS